MLAFRARAAGQAQVRGSPFRWIGRIGTVSRSMMASWRRRGVEAPSMTSAPVRSLRGPGRAGRAVRGCRRRGSGGRVLRADAGCGRICDPMDLPPLAPVSQTAPPRRAGPPERNRVSRGSLQRDQSDACQAAGVDLLSKQRPVVPTRVRRSAEVRNNACRLRRRRPRRTSRLRGLAPQDRPVC